jgi:hypothetical protein
VQNNCTVIKAGAHPDFVVGGGGGADTEAMFNLCLILKSYVIKILS